jgi:hypothetical protein
MLAVRCDTFPPGNMRGSRVFYDSLSRPPPFRMMQCPPYGESTALAGGRLPSGYRNPLILWENQGMEFRFFSPKE